MTVSRLTEEDFSTTISDLGEYIELPVLEINEGDYLVAYGHIEKEEFLNHCNAYLNFNTEGDFTEFGDDDEVLWTYAKRKESPGFYQDDWAITWKGVHPTDEDAFPITVINTW